MIALPSADRPGVLAELGQSCGSDVGAYVEAVHAFADAGAWGVKVQMIDPERLAAPGAAPYWQTTRYAETQAQSFALAGVVPHDGWGRVREACAVAGVAFVATPFDLGALDPLADLDPDAVKIASGDITFRQLVEGVGQRFAQVILSTGASDDREVRSALRWLEWCNEWVLPLACSLEYPCPWESANLARIGALVSLTGVPCGYSDHTVQTDLDEAYAAGMAVGAAGAVLAEKHVMVADDPDANVPDMDMALTPDLFGYYVGGLIEGASARGSASLGPTEGEAAAREGARRSVHVVAPLDAGHVITEADLACLRPCPPGAAEPAVVEWLVGYRLTAPVEAGPIVAWHADVGSGMAAVEVAG